MKKYLSLSILLIAVAAYAFPPTPPAPNNITGNAATATSLASNPTDCAANTVATAIDATGNLTCGYALNADIQAYDADLDTWAGISPSTDMQAFLGAANDTAARTELGLGTLATQNADNAIVTNLTVGGVANVTGLATLSGGSTYGTPVTHSASENATAATHYGQTHRITGAYTVTIPALSVGQKAQYCSTTAEVFSLDSTSPNYWKLAGTNTDAGDKLTSDGSSGCMYFEVTDTNTLMLIWSTLNLTDGGA